MTLDAFLVRALLAGIGLAILAAPLGCLVVWRRMAYFGSTIAHSGLLGVALGLLLALNLTISILVVSLALAALLILLDRQQILPMDSLLGLLSHAALAGGLVAAAMLTGQRLDLMGYLFGDIFSVTTSDLVWIGLGGLPVLGLVAWLWRPLVALSVHAELAAAEGLPTRAAETAFILLLAFIVAIAMKIVGILLIIAFLIMPATAARPFAQTPESMVVLAGVIGVGGVVAGLSVSLASDAPGGPAIVLALAVAAALSLAWAALRSRA
ncbi:MAG: metal ABC transporter permease [Hyphomicrobiaceae bacterium]|nr:metal ABC transporter permease [Hyphomicrobiaceae bacterium]